MIRGGALLAVGLAISNGLGYALNLAASRLLGPDEFGAFAALMGIVLVSSVGQLALQSVTARRLATSGPEAAPALLWLGRLSGLGIAGTLVLLTPALSAFLHLDAIQVTLVAAGMIPMTVVGVRLGLAQGVERFHALAALYVAVAAGKFGGALIGLAIGGSVTAGLVGMLLGASTAAGLAILVAPTPSPRRRRRRPDAAGELLAAALALFAFFGLTNVDVLLARHHLSEHEAGLYALGAVVAKGAFWFPQFIAVLAYPMLVDEARRGRAMRLSLTLVASSGAILTTATALLPGLVVRVLGGEEYTDLSGDVALFALAGSLFAVAQLLVYARLAQSDSSAGVRVAAVAIGLVLTVQLFAGSSVTAIVLSVCVAAAVLAAAGLVSEWGHLGAPRGADPPRPRARRRIRR